MDDFAIVSGPDGTVVTMARWEGGLLADHVPAVVALHDGPGGVPVAQPFRNGLLLGIAAGRRADAVVRRWRTRPWHAPAQLADGCRAGLEAGERLGIAVASVSALDGRLTWLRAGAVGCALLRGERVACAPAPGLALSRSGGGPLRAATVDVRRDDVLVLAATPLPAPGLAALAAGDAGPRAPAFLTAHFERGALEPRRPAPWRPASGAGLAQTGSGPGDFTVRRAKFERASLTCGSVSSVPNSSRSYAPTSGTTTSSRRSAEPETTWAETTSGAFVIASESAAAVRSEWLSTLRSTKTVRPRPRRSRSSVAR